MESLLMAAIVVAGLTLAAGLAWSMQPGNRVRWMLRGEKDTPIAELKHGEWAKVTGIVSAAAPTLTSPIGEDDCIGFRLEVTRFDSRMPVVLRRQTCQAFSISDETGKAHVDGPFFLALDLGEPITVPQRRRNALEEAGVPISGILFERRFTYREVSLRPGDRISVFGLVFLEPDPTVPAAGLRVPPVVARIHGSKDQPISVFRADDA